MPCRPVTWSVNVAVLSSGHKLVITVPAAGAVSAGLASIASSVQLADSRECRKRISRLCGMLEHSNDSVHTNRCFNAMQVITPALCCKVYVICCKAHTDSAGRKLDVVTCLKLLETGIVTGHMFGSLGTHGRDAASIISCENSTASHIAIERLGM